MIPVHKQYGHLIPKIILLYNQNMTDEEIGHEVGLSRRTIGKIRRHNNLNRSRSDAGALKNKSALDTDITIAKIRELRDIHTLKEIAAIVGGSISAVERICKKNGITLPLDYRLLQSNRLKKAWTGDKKEKASKRSKSLITPELRQKLSKGSKKLWEDGRYRTIQSEKRANQISIISSIQAILYSILDDLGVQYYREYKDRPNDPETVIGPYNFDCAIPRLGKPTLLIECNGDYWHSLEKAVKKDRQKQSYINNNLVGQYELKYLWEHEFKCPNKVSELLKYWLGITEVQVEAFELSDVKVKEIEVKQANELLEKYHYLSGCGRGGKIYGAFIDERLVAVCSFSSMIRQNLPFDNKTTKELSRFCIHPNYQKRNFGSWLISRCIKMLPNEIKTIISYCDTTFNHDGALYKASNFKLDGVVRPDYWYVNEDKWVMHKKTLYDHAKKMSMTEVDFAAKHGYKRVYGTEKFRFIFKR